MAFQFLINKWNVISVGYNGGVCCVNFKADFHLNTINWILRFVRNLVTQLHRVNLVVGLRWKYVLHLSIVQRLLRSKRNSSELTYKIQSERVHRICAISWSRIFFVMLIKWRHRNQQKMLYTIYSTQHIESNAWFSSGNSFCSRSQNSRCAFITKNIKIWNWFERNQSTVKMFESTHTNTSRITHKELFSLLLLSFYYLKF